MRIVNIPRGDLSTLYHATVDTGGIGNLGTMQMDAAYSGVFGNYMQELNQYYQSDAYLQLANEITNLHPADNLDIMVYLINNDDISVGKLMQQYIMASPYVARAYDEGLIAGFNYGYQKDQLMPYEDRVRYGEVMDGDMMYSTEYISDTDDNSSLDLEQQEDVRSTWEYIKRRIIAGIDPTE